MSFYCFILRGLKLRLIYHSQFFYVTNEVRIGFGIKITLLTSKNKRPKHSFFMFEKKHAGHF
jgi:hypothetical protein